MKYCASKTTFLEVIFLANIFFAQSMASPKFIIDLSVSNGVKVALVEIKSLKNYQNCFHRFQVAKNYIKICFQF